METKTFDHADITDIAPLDFCSECAASAMVHVPSNTFFCYCQHREVGIVKGARDWVEMPDITVNDFRKAILTATLAAEISLEPTEQDTCH